jgi:prophage tail gpP-like protein
MHLVDDENGNLVIARSQSGGSTAATLVEGQNIEAARLIMNQQWAVKDAAVITQQAGNDTTNGTASSQVKATATNSNYQGGPRPMTLLGEQPGNQQEAQLRVNHEIDLNNLDMLEAQITVSGWLMDDGTLWIEHVQTPEPVTIYSPMLFPTQGGKMALFLKGARHQQDDQGGTRTELTLCILQGLAYDPATLPGAFPTPPVPPEIIGPPGLEGIGRP